MKLNKLSIQEYLSLGYIYLVVLGIISDVLYFKFLGIDILNYSTILDVLITPINIMAHDVKVLIYFSLTALVGYLFLGVFYPRFHFKYREKKWYQRVNNVEKIDKKFADAKEKSGIPLISILVFAMFLGFGLGRGAKMSDRIKKGDIKHTHQITFHDNKTIETKIVGQNSAYIFYINDNEKKVSISPITQNIIKIKRLEKSE